MDERTFMFTGTATFMGKNFEVGRFCRDYICLKDLWDSSMHELLGLESLPGEKFRQEVLIPWGEEVREIRNDDELLDVLGEFEQRNVSQIHFNVNYIPPAAMYVEHRNQQPNNNPNKQPIVNPIQQPNNTPRQESNKNPQKQPNNNSIQQPNLNPEQDPIEIIRTSSPVDQDGNYCSDECRSYYQSSNSEWEESYNEKNENGDEMHNANNDNGDENDGLSDVNEDGISQEVVVDIGSDSDNDVQRDPPNRGTAFRVGVDGRITLEVGQMFRSGSHFREIIKDYSIQEGFKLKIIRNERNRITYKCEAEGCPWRVHGSPTFDRVTYMLKTLKNMHTCLSVTKNRDANSVWLGKKFETFIKENPNANIKVLGSVVLRQCGITVPDHTLYRAKRYALNIRDEDHKQSYNKLYKYGHIIMEKNPGSCVKLMTIRHNPNPQIPASFQRFYLSFQAQKAGYLQGCRPFIGLDGCHLKSPYEGILLCAIAIDANCGVYPIALGVVETESLDSWRWFLELLYRHVGVYESRKVCFMTDRQKGIIPALAEVWPNYNSRFCGRHILQNMMSRFKVDYLTEQFWPAANSSNLPEFLKAMEAIKVTSEAAYLYLTRIPLESWTIHKFDTICKTDHNTNSVVEAFNSWLNKFRALPMLTLMEKVRQKLMKRIHDRYEAAMRWESNIPPAVNRKLQKAQLKGRYLDPLRCGEYEFEIIDNDRQLVVKLDKRTCDCGLWVISGIPCKHAMACITKTRDNVENYVDDYLKKAAYLKTYSNKIHAIPDENLWPESQFETVLPPVKRRRAGRPRLSRKKGSNEPMRVQRSVGLRCGKCKEVGHNSRTCKNNPTTEAVNTAPSMPQKVPKRKRNENGTSSTHSGLDSFGPAAVTSRNARAVSGHGGNASSNSGPVTTIGLGGPTTSASGTITRVLWFPSTREGNSIPRDVTNNMSTQPFTQW